jgi:hypothetical protein
MGFFGSLQEHKDRFKNFLEKLTNDAHVPIAIGVFIATFTWVCKGHDLPPGFVSSLYAFYGFLGGHALVYQKWPDGSQPTTVVNVDNDNTNANTNANTNNVNTPPAPTPAPASGSDQPKG